MGLSLSFAADLSYSSAFNVTQGRTASIDYAFTPGPATLSVYLPLGDYFGLFGLKNTRYSIPIGNTPIEEYQLSLTGLLGVPKYLASVNMVIQPSLSAQHLWCTQGDECIHTQASTLTWPEWCEKSIEFCSEELGQALVFADFVYALDLRITLTMLLDLVEVDLIPNIPFLTLDAPSPAFTVIQVVAPEPSWWDRNGLAAASFVVEIFALYLVLVVANRVFEK